MALVGIIENNYAALLRCLETSNKLLGKLRSVEFLKGRIPNIKQQVTLDDKNDALLTALLEVPDELQQSVMDSFIAALRSCGQDHVANIFRKESDKVPMSDEHSEMLDKQTDELCKFLDPENVILQKLLSLGVITRVDNRRIRGMPGVDDKVEELIDTILRKSDEAFEALINILKETGQSHVTFILTGKGDSRPLSEHYREKMKANRAAVVRSVFPLSLVSTLISKGVFTSYDQQRVESRQTITEKSEMMLDLIARKSQEAFDGFIDTLQRCDHEHVVQELMGPVIAAKVEAVVNAGNTVVDLERLEDEILAIMQRSFANDDTDVNQLNEVLTSNDLSVLQVVKGSIIVKFRCRDYAALASLQELYSSKTLDQLFTEAFCPKVVDKGVERFHLSIPDKEFQRCLELKLMTPEHHEALQSSAEWLMDKVAVSDELLDKLSLGKLLTQAVTEAVTSEQQVKTLLDILSRQPDSVFNQLLNALDDTQQNEAASNLRAFEATQRKNTVTETSGKKTCLLLQHWRIQLVTRNICLYCYDLLTPVTTSPNYTQNNDSKE